MRLLLALAALGLALLTACGGAPEGRQAGATQVDVVSESGSLHAELRSTAGALARGKNSVTLAVTQADTGEAAPELSMSMVPFMPAMGHGSPVVPTFSAQGGGQYRFDDVVLNMPGLWELRTAITGPQTDSVVFDCDID